MDEKTEEPTTMMTKKHFKALAEALKFNCPGPKLSAARIQWVRDCNSIADVCRQSNPNFDRGRFLTACGV